MKGTPMMRFRLFIVAVVLYAALAFGAVVTASGSAGPADEGEQVVFVIDDSSSMTEAVADPQGSGARSRWELVQHAYPEWINRLGRSVRVGAVSVGGGCGSPPAIRFPAGADTNEIAAALRRTVPAGQTKLNAALEAAPDLFDKGVRGQRKLVVLSDGLNTCPPAADTCELAKRLFRDHGITIDVVALITDPGMLDQFRCITTNAHGILSTPTSLSELVSIPLPRFDPWPYVVLATGFVSLLFAAQILYRHGHHVLGWAVATSTLAGGILMITGTLALYLTLFAGRSLPAAALGLAVLFAVLVLLVRRETGRFRAGADLARWSIGVIAAVTLLMPAPVSAAPASCEKVAKRDARYHHVLAIDGSGSVASHLDDMKALLVCYAQMYAAPGEAVTLLVFGNDEHGGVRHLGTFTVPQNGSTDSLASRLDDLRIQRPRLTRTYFQPLAEHLRSLLLTVHLAPVVLVLSDGESDAYADAAAGKIAFQEVPFESFAKRGLYSAPGMSDWKAAIQGGEGIDLTALFQRPLAVRRQNGRASARLTPAIEPCLLDPDLVVETDDTLVLRPGWLPFSPTLTGTFSIRAWHDCGVTRLRSFNVELVENKKITVLKSWDSTPIPPDPRTFSIQIARPPAGDRKEATIRITLVQGETTRTVYPAKPAIIVIDEVSYLAEHGDVLGVGAVVVAVIGALSTGAMRRRRQRSKELPILLKSLDGPAVAIYPGRTATIGDPDVATLGVTGVPAGTILGTIEYAGVPNQLRIQPGNSFRVRVNGVDGVVVYRAGETLEFCRIQDGTSFQVTLHVASKRDLRWNPLQRVTPVGAPASFPDFGPVSTSDSGSSHTDGYI
jgi:hypothetical protein